jgi:hypothetical protein
MSAPPVNSDSTMELDVIARYFLRRLALAHLKSHKPSVQYNNALADTIGVFVAFPVVGFASFVVILSLRWAPSTIAKWFGLSPRIWMIAVVVLSMFGGHWWLNKRLTRYREDRTLYLSFSSDSDRRIVFWQRLTVFATCAVLVPFLALVVTFGTQVITRAFN